MQRDIIKKLLSDRNQLQRYQIQKRNFLFLIVPMAGAAVALVIGGALSIYAMEKYRIYQANKEKSMTNVGDSKVINDSKDDSKKGTTIGKK